MTPDFNSPQPVQAVEITALESIQRAEIDVQITTAKRYPRQLTAVKQSMMSFATLDQETAEACFYTLPRGGKNIQGPSIRLAEIALSCYGNIRAGSRVVSTVSTGPNPHVVIQSVCHDLEKNIAVTIEKRRRITKKKSRDTIDEDDINLAANAGAAIAFRDAVFKVIPLALIKPVYEQAKRVAIGDAKTLVDRRAKMVETFGKMGVTKDMILLKLEKKSIDEVNLDDMETLIGLHTALKDGDTTIDETFPAKQEKPKFAAPAPATAPTPTADTPPPASTAAPPETPQPTTQTQTTAPTPRKRGRPPKQVNTKTPMELLIEAGVFFDDFTDWCVSTGRFLKAKDWPSYDDVPATVWTALSSDPIGVGKAIAIYGKKSDPLPAEYPAGEEQPEEAQA